MAGIKRFINKLSKAQKVICLILILSFVLLLSIGIPTIARFKNRSTIIGAPVWDGTTASSYREGSGSQADPYIISNGSELAYFAAQLSTNDYSNKYFALSNDIVLNNGIFNYDSTNGIQYIIDAQTYYVGYYSNKYYSNIDRTGTETGTINIFSSLNNFKGNFDGGSFRIYGLYLTDETSEEVALFTNLQGNVHDLYVENSIVYGGTITAGIASTTNNASLSNVLFDGYVAGKSTILPKNINTVPTASVITLQNTEMTNYIDLTNNIPFIGSEIVSTSITGNYVINNATEAETSIKINGVTVTNGSFDIDLGTTIIDSIPVLTSTTAVGEPTLTFSNLSYNINYKYAVSGGIVAISNNTTIENTINKADIYGYTVSGGLVGVTTSSLNINQSYNTGNIDSEYVSGGLVGTIEKSSNNIVVSKSYNAGAMTALDFGGLLGVVNNNSGFVSLNNVFNTSSTNYSIGTIDNATVNVTNAYFVNSIAIKSGVANGSFVSTTLSNLKTKAYILSNLSFSEFIDFNDLAVNTQNAWVYENDSLPILFVDDISDPIANIHVNVYSWNNLSYDVSPVKVTSNITFSIEAADELVPIKEKYYYVSNSKIPLTKEEISGITSWTTYSSVEQISVEGFYIVYAKIVDYNDNITYINTDLLILDLPGASISTSIDGNTWSNLRDVLDYVYIDREKNVTVKSNDDISGISSIKYYVTDQILTVDDLNALSDTSWSTYSNGIPINEVGTHIIYIQIIDSFDYITYINTDYIVLNGYTENSLTIGRNPSSYLNADPYITNKSAITMNASYSNVSSELINHTHNLMSNILLPLGTKITLIDQITDKVYEYQITTVEDNYNYNNSCDGQPLDCIKKATYPFTLFKEVGTGATSKLYTESSYYADGMINENFTTVLDLSSTSILTNYDNVSLHIELRDSNGINVRPTLYNSIKKFNIYSNVNSEDAKASLYLTTDYNGSEIIFNSESSTDINITSGLSYKSVDSFKIIDTTYEDNEIGLSIKMVDSNGNIVDRDYLKSIIFKVGSNIYYPEEDNVVRINLGGGITDVTKALTIVTYENNGSLKDGTYYFKISNYASYDGHYYDELGNTELSIPVNVSDNNPNIAYSFDVIMDDANRIISKTNDVVNVSFNILQKGSLNNPNIRISLYKKDQLTAYDQNYSIVNLSNYVSDVLNQYTTNVYYVSTNPIEYNGTENSYNNFVLNLITANFENTGYKFVLDLYDDTRKIGTIEKNFIVK